MVLLQQRSAMTLFRYGVNTSRTTELSRHTHSFADDFTSADEFRTAQPRRLPKPSKARELLRLPESEETMAADPARAQKIVRDHVLWSIGAGLVPIPLMDVAAVTAIQNEM